MEPTFSYIYSLPYIVLFLMFFLLFLWENKLKKQDADIKIVRYVCMIIFLVFFGFRGYLDTDFMLYYPLYESTPVITDIRGITNFFSINADDFILKIEPGFKVLLVLLKSISPNYFLLQIVSSLIDVLFLNYFFKKYSPQYVLGFMMFCIFSGLIIEINLLRNSKAIFIFIYSLQFLKDRNPYKYFICNSIGLLFHSSAIFYFPLYFFLHKKLHPAFVWGIFVLGNVLYLGQIRFITPLVISLGNLLGGVYELMAEGYSKDSTYSSGYGITIGYLEKIIIFVLIYKFYSKIVECVNDERTVNIFFNLLFLFTSTYLLLSEFSVLIDRITTLFAVSYWILFPYLYATLERWAKMVFSCVLLLFGIYRIYKTNFIITRKYENILWSNPSISKAYYIANKHLEKILNPKKEH
ncbi:hypothetical protein DRF69_18740 [Chryseobacterium sp. 5_R23647]|nr:hypothetical protein DRF69_18740 [Chryseobacterium sp. 5_R23647]